MDTAIRVEGLVKCYGSFTAVDQVSFTVNRGEIFGILGPNGAGKTTLCDVISGMTRVSRGRVHFDGVDITRMPEVGIARLGVGRKFQTPTVFDSLDVVHNMELALPG